MNAWMIIGRAYLKRFFLQWLAWRGFAITLVANQVVGPLVSYAIWSAAMPSATGLTTYYVALVVVQLMTVSYENHTFSQRIYTGDFQDDLLRPHPVVILPLAENLAIRMWHVLLGLPLFLGLILFTGFHTTPERVLWAVPAVILAALLQFLYTYSLALSAFWTQQAFGLVTLGQLATMLLGGVFVPVQFLPTRLQPILQLLPFNSMIGFPAEVLSGPVPLRADFAVQLAWIGCFGAVAAIVWRAGLRKYTAVGG